MCAECWRVSSVVAAMAMVRSVCSSCWVASILESKRPGYGGGEKVEKRVGGEKTGQSQRWVRL